MRQALHIFRKDVRYLWREICLVQFLVAVFVWTETHSQDPWWIEMLLPVTMGYLIARLIHAEAVPGDRQFWITRPYGWKNLLGAKLLFMLVFVNLAISIAQMLILFAGGFPLGHSLPGLLWSQVLMILILSLPIAALAAMTAGMVPFIFSTLILLAIAYGGEQMLLMSRRLPLQKTLEWPAGVEWVRHYIAIIAIAAIVLPILYMQYKKRQTLLSRTFAVGGAALGLVAYVCMPWPFAFAVQSRISKQPFDGSSLRIALDPSFTKFFPEPRLEQVEVDLSIAVSGVPGGSDLQADALTAIFQGPDGRAWKSGSFDFSNSSKNSHGVFTLRGTGLMDPIFFNEERGKPITLKSSLYLTLFGNARAKTVALQDTPVNVMDGLQCYSDIMGDVLCRSAFRWPNLMVSASVGGANPNVFTRFISYSPFPASMHLNPIETRLALASTLSTHDVTIIVSEPLAHFRRDVEVRGVRLVDFPGGK